MIKVFAIMLVLTLAAGCVHTDANADKEDEPFTPVLLWAVEW